MALANYFDKTVSDQMIQRIQKLNSDTAPLWGKMSVSQMLAHCCVTYEMIFTDKHPKPNAFVKFILKLFVKNTVVNEIAYKKNSQTAPAFLMKDEKNFEQEKQRLIDYIQKTQALGASYFDHKESHSFGALSSDQWNNMLYKHLDHHLSQFGA
jgi:hypothetical protein